jgi:RimJ/RimL family protein N-acetyltransferase
LKIILQPQSLIVRYVEQMTQCQHLERDKAAFGLLDSEDKLVAGVVFNDYAPPSIAMHIAAEHMTPAFICALMDYAFRQAKCTRITGYIRQQNINSRAFAEHLGAVLEGTMVRMAPDGGNVCIYGLQVESAQRWLTPQYKRKLERAFA